MTHVVPNVIRPIRALWNQLIGLVFCMLAVGAAPSLVRNVRRFTGDPESVFRVALGVIFCGVMLYFGITSLWRSRRITRS